MEGGELAFEHFLALKLGRTVDELRETMTQDEFVRWNRYFAIEHQRRELELAKLPKG